MIINYYLTEIVYDYRNNVLIINEVIRKDKISTADLWDLDSNT